MRHDDPIEQALDEALARRARYAAPPALRRRIEEQIRSHHAPPRPRVAAWRAPAAALATGLALAAAVAVYYERAVIPRVAASATLDAEAVNDHLRVLYSERPLEVESGGIHRVKPWFAGKLDFAPVVAFAGDDEFPLQGGAIGYFLDRKAATFVFKRRLHTISLFVFRADGLTFPSSGRVPLGRVEAHAARVRGFNLLLWQSGELGYALVSDVDAAELRTLGARITP